jgi:hypothetical protein
MGWGLHFDWGRGQQVNAQVWAGGRPHRDDLLECGRIGVEVRSSGTTAHTVRHTTKSCASCIGPDMAPRHRKLGEDGISKSVRLWMNPGSAVPACPGQPPVHKYQQLVHLIQMFSQTSLLLCKRTHELERECKCKCTNFTGWCAHVHNFSFGKLGTRSREYAGKPDSILEFSFPDPSDL